MCMFKTTCNQNQLREGDTILWNASLLKQLVNYQLHQKILFLRHQDMREDLKLKPEWEEYTEKFAGGLIPSLCPIRNFIGGLFS